MARETLFETQALSFVLSDFGYMYQTTPSPFVLTAGESYIIVWEGQEYVRTAWAFDSLAPGTVGVGSTLPAGGEADPDGLPVTLGYIPATDYAAIFSLEGEGPYSVGLYKEIAEPARLILRDPDGTEQEYPMRSMLEVDTTEGGTVLYSKGQILDGLTIQLDFSGGDMEITAPDGYLVQSAVIAKPENLKPENIAKNEVVAGIEGTHEGGGGGGAVECVEWVQVMHYATRQQATTVSGTVKATIPKDCLERNVYTSKLVASGSSSITITSGIIPQYAWGENGLTITEDDSHITFAYTNTWSSGLSAVKYKYMMIQIIVGFVMGNMYIDTSSGSAVLIGKPGLKYLPIVESSGYVNCSESLTKIDFSQADIEEYERLTVDYDANLTEIILPVSCTTIGQYACSSCTVLTKLYSADVDVVTDYQINLPNVKTLETYAFRSAKFTTAVLPSIETIGSGAFYLCSALTSIDMSGVSAVPTLGSSTTIPTNSGLQILVPAALYDEWIAATNWTAYADYIVAV